ncbi:MAG TPA: hypothetical protein VM077_02005 [Candidatus Limnocylindrales bacterium]|nr:hypothetical protein [Candidatus Limnocylindrales bacterium]
MDKYIRGSEWRKWDLHIHSPVSALNNQFEGSSIEEKWEKYLEKLSTLTDTAVVGITDYFSVDGYKYIRDNSNLTNIDLILPNVELRIVPVTDTSTPINLHIIFNPSIVDTLESKFFSSLEFTYQGETYKCIKDNLINLGRKYSNDETLSEQASYEAGVNQFKTNLTNLQQIFSKDKELRDNSVIVVSNSSRDGNSGIQHSSLSATRQEIYRFSHCIFSGNPNDFTYFLGNGVDNKDEIIRKHGNLKSCIHGSDAHSLEQIGLPCARRGERGHTCSLSSDTCDMRFCWIKADTTFDGLKQIIYEPGERVKIQKLSPFEDRKKVYIDEISLEGSVNFIVPNAEFYLNRELVTIIGGRGSGKSAFLDLVAFLNEEHAKADQNGKPKLIEFYRDNVELKNPSPGFSLKAKLIDKDNNQEEFGKTLDDSESLSLPFLYIGQEQLSLIATDDKELTLKVCELISLNFSDIEKPQLIEVARNLIADVNIIREEIIDIHQKYPDFKKQISFEQWLRNYIDRKSIQKKTLSSEETKKLLEEISKEIDRKMRLRDFSSDIEDLLVRVKSITLNKEIADLNRAQKDLYKENLELIPEIVLDTQEKSIKILQKKVWEEITQLNKSIEEKKIKLSTLGIKEDITALVQSIEAIQKEINNASRDLVTYEEKRKILIKKIEERNDLYSEIIKEVKLSKDIIDEKFIEFTSSRDSSSTDEKELFKNIISDISIEGAIDFKQEIFCNYILNSCVDRRRVRSAQDIKEIIAGKDKGIIKDITLDSLALWINNNLNSFLKEENFNEGGINRFIDFIFTKWHEFIHVKAIARLKEIPTEKLSVGQRGTLLLKIYLATASVKQIFIVDQPEDNLDNHFIMNQLVPLIKRIKKVRQIILSTHNANLVVNADAEQVIVSQLDQDDNKGYISGSIENPIINIKIKDILEGGEEAFKKRESKYGFGQI